MTGLALLAALALPFVCGSAVVLLVRGSRPLTTAGEVCWTLGAGGLVGTLLVTLWMRALSALGVSLGFAAIALPLLALAIAVIAWTLRREPRSIGLALRAGWSELRAADQPGVARSVWFGLLAWLGLRAALLLVEVISRPLYPWEAWTRWATKARVFCELRAIVPFGSAEAWLAAGEAIWFDAGPRQPVTVPLLQSWPCIAMNRWDDTLVNLPWWLAAIALCLALFGALRSLRLPPLGALLGTWLAASLPLLDAQVALAGYADLFLAAFVTLAMLALLRWNASRARDDAILAAIFACALPLVKSTGLIWMIAMIPALVVALAPARGPRIVAVLFAAAILALLLLARTHPTLAGIPLHLEYVPAWGSLGASLFLLDNWHLLWYAALATLTLGWRQALASPLAPLTLMIAAGVMFTLVVAVFPAVRGRLDDAMSVNRTVLVFAPLVCAWIALTIAAWRSDWIDARRAPPVAAPG